MIIPRPQKETYYDRKICFSKEISITLPEDESVSVFDALKIFLPHITFHMSDCGDIRFEKETFRKKGAYTFIADNDGVILSYGDFEGARNAAATLAQLWRIEEDGYSIPSCRIEDYPSFEVRSFMLDLARGIGRKEEIKETLIRIAMLKYNQLHLHLIDSEGIAWQSQAYPKLTGPRGDQYSMEFFKSLNTFCKKLGIEILPEIEVPAHNKTILSCYPELFCELDKETDYAKWVLCAGNDKTYEFYKGLISELIEMFPDCRTIHIGGDEVHFEDIPSQQCFWDKCPRCNALGFESNEEIYYYAIRKVYDIVKTFGKEAAMWNDWIDISKPCPLPKDILIYFWRVAMEGRGPTEGCSMQAFLEQGYKVVNAHFSETYLSNKAYANENSIRDWTPAKRPVTDEKYRSQILGGEVCAWEFGNEERYRFYRFTLPAPLGMLSDRLWNGSVCEYDDTFKIALTRTVLGYNCPENLNIYKLIGTIMLEARTEELGIINENTPSSEELKSAILSMIPITVSDDYGHFAALYYTECLNWILQNR